MISAIVVIRLFQVKLQICFTSRNLRLSPQNTKAKGINPGFFLSSYPLQWGFFAGGGSVFGGNDFGGESFGAF
jgi:hypothetical protein